MIRDLQRPPAAEAKPKKTPPEEQFKRARHPLDIWPDVVAMGASGTAELPKEWAFRMRWFGLFWEGPRSDTFMLRIKVHGGRLRADQLAGLCDLAEAHCLPFLDITTRQGIQVRGIAIADVPAVFAALERLGLTSMQSGADNIRNLTACPLAGIAPDELADVTPLVRSLAARFIGKRDFADLPRKFNIAVSGCGTNCTHPELHDIAVQAVRDAAGAVGFSLRVGGQPSTSHFVSRDLEVFLTEAEVPDVCAAIAAVFRDHGDRTNRKRARMGHLIEAWGLDRFREAVEAALGRELPRRPAAFPVREMERDPIGVHPQRQAGLRFVGIPFPVGRVTLDQGRALARLAAGFGSGEVRTTNRQNLLLVNVPHDRLAGLLEALDRAGIPRGGSVLRAGVAACSGSTHCKLATVETKHRMVSIVEGLEAVGLGGAPLNIALSACPNSCANHATADIGLLGCRTKVDGETVDAFHLHFGGGTGPDTAFGRLTFRQVPGWQLDTYLAYATRVYARRRRKGESFRAFCDRHTPEALEMLFHPKVMPGNARVRRLAARVRRALGDPFRG